MSDKKPRQDLRLRTKKFALRIITMCESLPDSRKGRILGDQIFRSGTSVAANYREAYRARSRAESISKLGDCRKELEETILWFELLGDSETVKPTKLALLLKEVFFSSRRRHTRLQGDWSSDVCSSD